MFKRFFFLGSVAGVSASLACYVYTKMYYSLIVDFSEAANIWYLSSTCMVVTMAACILNFIIQQLVKKQHISDFIFNGIFSLVSIGFVFYMLNADDPEFKSENAILFAEFYKGFIMPMLFFPLLTWFTFKPIIIRS